jgi:heme-degrading monooxygenase HmoA
MIYEIADLKIQSADQTADFLAAVTQAKDLFQQATGCGAMKLERVIEDDCAFRLVVEWATLEDHTEGFRSSDNFAQWRALVSPYFARPPEVVHTETILTNF